MLNQNRKFVNSNSEVINYFFPGSEKGLGIWKGAIMTFGEKVRLARTTLNLSQAELSEITGISERSLYTYEQLNTIPRKSNVQKLADALHVSVTYLMDEQEEDTQDRKSVV